MRNSRNGSAKYEFFCVMGLVFIAISVTWHIAWDFGHERGVRDALAGKYTVVEMPDGTSRVCAVKKEVSK